MKFALNEAVKLASRALLGREPVRQITFESEDIYPKNVLVYQDGSAIHYLDELKGILFCTLSDELIQDNKYLEWQLRQLYRILNAAIASIHPTVVKSKTKLIILRTQLEENSHIKNWLAEVDAEKFNDLVCCGHGKIFINDGYIKDKDYKGCQVISYAPIGAALYDDLASAIENDSYDKENIYIEDIKKEINFTPSTYDFPKTFSASNKDLLPDCTLYTAGPYKAKIIEKKTGRVLFETDESIKLSRILVKFPNSTIHWSACQIVRASNELHDLSPNANYYVGHNNNDPDLKLLREGDLRRLRESTFKIKYDPQFALFLPKRLGPLNDEIKRELKRKKSTL